MKPFVTRIWVWALGIIFFKKRSRFQSIFCLFWHCRQFIQHVMQCNWVKYSAFQCTPKQKNTVQCSKTLLYSKVFVSAASSPNHPLFPTDSLERRHHRHQGKRKPSHHCIAPFQQSTIAVMWRGNHSTIAIVPLHHCHHMKKKPLYLRTIALQCTISP